MSTQISLKNETLYNAIAYLVKNTSDCHLTKLIKLLYLFDIEHVRSVGIPATGMKYNAWEMGPVPVDLRKTIIESSNTEFNSCFKVENLMIGNYESYKINPLIEVDFDVFSKVQIQILESLAKRFKNHNAQSMIDETHKQNDPWHQVYEVEGKKSAEIPFELAVDSKDTEMIRARISLHVS